MLESRVVYSSHYDLQIKVVVNFKWPTTTTLFMVFSVNHMYNSVTYLNLRRMLGYIND